MSISSTESDINCGTITFLWYWAGRTVSSNCPACSPGPIGEMPQKTWRERGRSLWCESRRLNTRLQQPASPLEAIWNYQPSFIDPKFLWTYSGFQPAKISQLTPLKTAYHSSPLWVPQVSTLPLSLVPPPPDHSRGACCRCRYRFSHTFQLETSSGQSRIFTHRPFSEI